MLPQRAASEQREREQRDVSQARVQPETPCRPRLLLHACCAPCSTVPLARLRDRYDLSLLFYGPNIQPAEEYQKRLAEERRLCLLEGVPLLEAPYDPISWEKAVGPLCHLPEGSERCHACFRLRMEVTARQALGDGFDCFSVTLSVSRHKDSELLARIGREVGQQVGVTYLAEDFKKQDGEGLSARRASELGLYRQDYCGCLPSREESRTRRAARERRGT